jgi:hypothetical protein
MGCFRICRSGADCKPAKPERHPKLKRILQESNSFGPHVMSSIESFRTVFIGCPVGGLILDWLVLSFAKVFHDCLAQQPATSFKAVAWANA